MIRHTLHFKFKKDAAKADIKVAIEAFLDVKNHMAGIVNVEYRKNVGTVPSLIRGFEDVIWFDFENVEARDTYLTHESHKAAGAKTLHLLDGGKEAGLFICAVEI